MSIIKRLFLFLLLLGIIVSCFYGYLYFKKIKRPASNALNAIPLNVSFIIETKNIKETWKKLSQANLIWKDMVRTETFRSINDNGTYLDSLLSAHPGINGLLNNHPVYISAHPGNKNKIDFLFCISLPNTANEEEIKNFINKGFQSSNTTLKDHEGIQIIVLNSSDSSTMYFAIDKDILIVSKNLSLLENAISHLNSGTSLLNDVNFKKTQQASGDRPDAVVYINYKNLSPLLSIFSSSEEKSKALDNFATWTELDLNLKANEVLLSGYTAISDSTDYLSVFSTQKPQEISITSILPYNTSWFLYTGISDSKVLREKQKKHFNTHNELQHTNEYLLEQNKKHNTDLEQQLTSWTSNQAIFFAQPGANNTLHYFAAFSANNPQDAITNLKSLADSVSSNSSAPDTLRYKKHEILHLPVKNLLAHIWGNTYKNIENTYVTQIDNFIVFANSAQELNNLIHDIENNKTLTNDEYYNDFFEGHLDNEASIYFYSAVSYSTDIYKSLLNTGYKNLFNTNDSLIKKIQAVGIQFSFYDELVYTTAFIKHNPVTKKSVNTIWEVELDTTVSSAPQTVINHHTKTKDIFIQDDANKIYLINATGQIIWKRNLPEKIMGKVTQVDAFKNNKLQLLFNTASSVYLIDRNGNNVKKFPVKLPAPATAPLSVLDYESDKTYRILVPCADKTLYNYTIEGEMVQGWKKPESVETITTPILYFSVNKMDHLVCIDSKGALKTVNRQGEERLSLNTTIENTNGLKIIPAKNLDQTYITGFDTVQQCIVNLYMNNKKQNISLESIKDKTGFVSYDINNDKTDEYIITNNQSLMAFGNDESILFENSFKNNIKPIPFLFNVNKKGVYLGVFSPAEEEIFLFDHTGNQPKGLPVKGSGNFTVDDINNDGSLLVICIGTSNRLFAYQIE